MGSFKCRLEELLRYGCTVPKGVLTHIMLATKRRKHHLKCKKPARKRRLPGRYGSDVGFLLRN